MNIESGKTVTFKNLITFRSMMTQQQIQEKLIELVLLLQQKGIKKTGPMIYANHDTYPNGLIDMEILIPIDRVIPSEKGFTFVEELLIENALYKRSFGFNDKLIESYRILDDHINENDIEVYSPTYQLSVNEDKVPFGEEPIIDIYMEVV